MQILEKYFSDFTPRQREQFSALEPAYREWNEKINVISRKDIDSLYEKHVLHSLSIAAVFDFPAGASIVDLGTGGGFPGIPLAIFFPDTTFHLVDSIAKKLKVVDAVAETLGLTNVTTQHSRIEDIRNRKFDFVVSRAVAPLKDLWRWSRPLLKNQSPPAAGQGAATGLSPDHKPGLICLKGGELAAEIAESGTRPRMMKISELFPEKSFEDKFILYVPI
ncbi:MAG: 16S rRNA (guanine(527)-N(7))-methyltransferase RsmG [Chitinophagaceae bacterium]